jgi:hypothetical protein
MGQPDRNCFVTGKKPVIPCCFEQTLTLPLHEDVLVELNKVAQNDAQVKALGRQRDDWLRRSSALKVLAQDKANFEMDMIIDKSLEAGRLDLEKTGIEILIAEAFARILRATRDHFKQTGSLKIIITEE